MKKDTAGFTIPEILTVIIILGVLITGIASLFLNVQQTQTRTTMLDAATRAGQLQIETLRNNDYATLTPGEDIDFTDRLPDSLPPNRQGRVVVSEPQLGLRRVDVIITYTSHGRDERVELSSMIGILGITQ